MFEPSDTKSESPKKDVFKLDFSKLNIQHEYGEREIHTPVSSISEHDSAMKWTDSKATAHPDMPILHHLSRVDEEPFDLLYETNNDPKPTE